MKKRLKAWLSSIGWRLQKEPRGAIMGYDLWRDLSLLLDATPVCIDAGANHGNVTENLLQLRPNAQIHLFEPSPSCNQLLHSRFAGRPRIHLVQSALGERVGEIQFHEYENDQLSSCLPLTRSAQNPFRNESEQSTTTVPVARLDDYGRQQNLVSIELLKTDTQGFDLSVLRGADALFSRKAIRLVLVELNFSEIYERQSPAHEIIGYLDRHGIKLVDLYEKCRQGHHLGWCTALFLRE